MIWALLFAALGAAAGVVIGWLAARTRSAGDLARETERAAQLEQALTRADSERSRQTGQIYELAEALARAHADLEHEQLAGAEKLELIGKARNEISDTFGALSAAALERNNRMFIELARETLSKEQAASRDSISKQTQTIEHLVNPLRDSLAKVDSHVRHLESARQEAYGAVREQLQSIKETHKQLQDETRHLVQALRMPSTRGRWGEIQLRRVVEMAGMVPHCDFIEQASVTTAGNENENNVMLRPDMIVKLPGGKQVVIDAKTPMQAFLDSLETDDDTRRQQLAKDHARGIRTHITKLAAKSYWEQFQPAPDFVVLFLPGETFFNVALEADPDLIEFGLNEHVLLTTPTTLIALLRSIAYGWRQERMAENAQVVSDLARTLYKRLQVFAEHIGNVGTNLERSVGAYNRAVGSLEGRVLVSARRFNELGVVGDEEIGMLQPVETTPRKLAAPELAGTIDLAKEPDDSAQSTPAADVDPEAANV